jgi:hypothetical protein
MNRWVASQNSGISDASHPRFCLIDTNSVVRGEGLPFVFERFELLGPFEQLGDRLDKAWSPSGSRRAHAEKNKRLFY